MRITSGDVAELREKYEAMLALRVAHDRARADPSFVEPDPRAAMAALAARFPGALREIDDLPLDVIRERMAALRIAERSPEIAARWMVAQAAFHRLARGALATKRWLGKQRATSEATEGAFARSIAEGALPIEALVWARELAGIARPVRGRVMNAVYARVAADLGIDEAEVRVLVFGVPRRRR